MTTTPQDGKVEDLAAVPLFAALSRDDLSRVARLGTEIAVPAGIDLCRQGEYAAEFFILIEGAAVATRDGIERATFSEGSFFGELGLLHGGTRMATVTTIAPTRVLVLQPAEFRTLVETEPSVAARLLYEVGARFRQATETLG